jgi:uncharacterized repeat protein (TIGR03803 family)
MVASSLANSAPIVLNPIPDQTNTYGAVFSYTFPTNTFGDSDPGQTLTYTASNLPPGITFIGLARTFSGTNTEVGTYPVTVTATDNGSPPLSTNTTFQFAVGKAPLLAQALDQTNTYANIYLDNYYGVNYTGFVLGQNVYSLNYYGLPALTSVATNGSPVGVYPTMLSGGSDPHYDFICQGATLTIVPAPLFVQSDNICRQVGHPNPPLTGSLLGVTNGDNIQMAFSTPATNSSPVGDYPIIPGLLDPGNKLGNYSLTSVTGLLHVVNFGVNYNLVRSFGFPRLLGSAPEAALIQSANGDLYGTASLGVFRIHQDGTGYQLILNFNTAGNPAGRSLGLTEGNDGVLYGTTVDGGAAGFGTVFRVNRDGSGYSLLHSFVGGNSDADSPTDVLQATNGVLYGLARGGFGGGKPVVFRIDSSGSNYAILHEFDVANGVEPVCLFQSSDGKLYGTTMSWNVYPTVFRLELDGTGFTTVYTFASGVQPSAREASDGVFYGADPYGGTVFKLNRDGTGHSDIHVFASADGTYPFDTVVEGPDGALYGTTAYNGPNFQGTVFRVTKDGSSYAVLHSCAYNDGGPRSLMKRLTSGSAGQLHGVSYYQGANGGGCLFKLDTNGLNFQVTWSFSTSGGDGYDPGGFGGSGANALLEASDGRFYGVTSSGGSGGGGTAFGMNKDGTGYVLLHEFNGTNGEGTAPIAGLIEGQDGGLYGSTSSDPINYAGALFRVSKDGSQFTVLHSFTGSLNNDGSAPAGSLVQDSNGVLYGVTSYGGTNYGGTVFSITTNGVESVLRHLSSSEGANPIALTIASNGALYVTAQNGGAYSGGAVLKLNTDGSGFTSLRDFFSSPGDGWSPEGRLLQRADGLLYGVTGGGGVSNLGTIYRMDTNGGNYQILRSLGLGLHDAATPYGGLAQGMDGALYNATSKGGLYNFGAAFRIDPNSLDYCVIHNFGPNGTDGLSPVCELIEGSDGNLYGTASAGGVLGLGLGAIFRLGVTENQSPLVNTLIPDQTNVYGASLSYAFPANTFADPDAGQTLTYSASGLPPGISFNGPSRTFSGAPTNAGPYVVTVTATDNGTPPLSTNTTFQFWVARAALAVEADNQTRPYGQANPLLTGSLTGVTNGDNITVSFTTTATASSPPGNYPITPVLNDPNNRLQNYGVSTQNGILDVTCGTTLVVTTTADSSPGSLRQAILDANADPCTNNLIITFSIPGPGVHTIAPLTALPTITRQVTIDGYTQPGANPNTLSNADNAVLLIELSGASLGAPAYGLWVGADGCTIRGLVLNRFGSGYAGLFAQFANSNVFEGNFIGTDATGTNAPGNASGIFISGGTGNRVGGLTPASRNLVAGNNSGISLNVTTGTEILGNFVGLGADGLTPLPNYQGISLNYCYQTQVGGAAAGARNILAANTAGFYANQGSSNVIQGNFIGTDVSGQLARTNVYGIALNECGQNLIGGANAGEGNVISASSNDGVLLEGLGSSGNIIAGNLVGTDATGTSALPNYIGVSIYGPGNNLIGGTAPAAGNVICANTYAGISLNGLAATNNLVQGNFIGTDRSGLHPLGSGGFGIVDDGSASGNLIGGTTPGARNVICLNLHGIAIYSGSGNVIQGNFIGTDVTGTRALGNSEYGIYLGISAPGTLIGGTAPGAGNLISGNGYDGIHTASPGALIQGNFIGTDLTGLLAIPNGPAYAGVWLDAQAPFTLVGGTNIAARNLIAGGTGIIAYSPSNTFQGNYVGIGADGQTLLGTPGYGITMISDGNLAGGYSPGAANVVSGHFGDGVRVFGSNNVVQGNFIGTDATGTLARGNHNNGILVSQPGNLIGGLTPGARNLISGNQIGITVSGNAATGNTIQGNYIGADITGLNALGNVQGMSIEGAPGNLIGGTTPAARNIISGSGGYGIGIVYNGSSNNIVQGNYIGVAADGLTPLPNYAGLRFVNGAIGNLIGGTALNAGNVIAHDTTYGISAIGVGVTNNAILGNSIFGNGWWGIDLGEDGLTANDPGDGDDGPNHLQNFPALASVKVNGGQLAVRYQVDSAPANSSYPLTVEFFLADAGGQGKTFLYRDTYTTPQAFVNIAFAPASPFNAGDAIVATATDANGNTSEFSAAAIAANCATLALTNTVLPIGLEGNAYNITLGAAGGSAPYTFAVTSGTLPANLTLAGNGLLSGTPASTGTFPISITVTSSLGCLVTSNYVLTVLNPDHLVFGLNFAATDPDAPTSSLAPSETAGVVPSANWNNLSGASGSASAMVADGSGVAFPSAVSVTWSSPNTSRATNSNNQFPAGPNRKLLSGYLDSGNTSASGVFITVSNIPSAISVYDVYVYFLSDSGANRGGAYTITNQAGFVRKYGSTMAGPSTFVEDPGTDSNNSLDGNYLRFRNLSGSWLTLKTDTTLTSPNGFRAPVNAVAIVALPCPPAITSGPIPAAATNAPGDSITFTVQASGAGLTYQWRRDGTNLVNAGNLSGVTSNVLSISPLQWADFTGAGHGYTCVASGSCSPPVVSAEARLILNGLPVRSTGLMNSGRFAHTATLLSNGKVLVAGGRQSGQNYLSSAELYDPASGAWTTAGSMAVARLDHTATLLSTGKILVAGGQVGSGIVTNDVELFDPLTGSWTAAAPLGTPRGGHTATLLPDGRVLIAGGYGGGFSSLASAEIYNPASGVWTPVAPMLTARYSHTATLLPNGKVMAACGYGNSGFLSSAEVFDPVAGAWTATAGLAVERAWHTATLMPNGKVLVTGGYRNTGLLSDAEVFNPVAGTWSPAGNMTTARYFHAATLLPNGKVLVTAGFDTGGSVTSSVELYDPTPGTWGSAGTLTTARGDHTATLLAGGVVLLAGGTDSFNSVSGAELYDISAGIWTATNSLPAPRRDHTATLLPNGTVLLAGGIGSSSPYYFSSALIYDPAAGTWTATGGMYSARLNHTATLLPNGQVLVAGGSAGSAPLSGTELYDPGSGFWSPVGSLNTGRYSHLAVLLPNGKVLVAGGYDSTGFATASTEVFDPASSNWTPVGPMSAARNSYSSTLLPNGKVLVAGGYNNNSGVMSGAELFDSATGTWSATGSLNTNRDYHTATLLPNGKVLVAGGNSSGAILSTAELYDPATGAWTPTGSMTSPRASHTATLLPNGKVLVAGGTGSGYLTGTELFDPASGIWTPGGPLNAVRVEFTATLLPNSAVMLVGGQNSLGGNLSSVEFFDAGLNFSNSWQPQITSLNSPLAPASNLQLAGLRFRGISEGASGNTQNSSADHPVVQLRSIESGQVTMLQSGNWTATSFASMPVGGFPVGYAYATMFVNGIPSAASIIRIAAPPVPAPFALANPVVLPAGAFQLSFSNTPGVSFTALAATNVSLPLSNWTVLGSFTEAPPGQFQFTDSQPAAAGQRYYRVRSP